MSAPLTKQERDALLSRASALERELYPPVDGPPEPEGPARVKLLDTYYQVLHEYGDRLPRVPFSRCPFSEKPLLRSLDPFGLDGPWWHKSRIVPIEEPVPPRAFQVILGAMDLHGRSPVEVVAEVTPGPVIPFVVPRLLQLPGMRAVVSRLPALEHGDVAHIIAYFSEAELPSAELHQHWLRQDLWFPDKQGTTSWITKNDPLDYDLGPWIESGHVAWIAPEDSHLQLRTGTAGCPFLGLQGDPHPQMLSGGERYLLEIPDGSPVNPFEDPGPEGPDEGPEPTIDWNE